MTLTRRSFTAALAAPAAAYAPFAGASGFPSEPLKLVVPGAAGSSPDIQARIVAPELSKALGQPVVVEDVPGAAGILAVQRVLRAPADGHTVLWGFNQLVTMNPNMYPKLPYKAADLVPIGLVGRGGYVMLANKALPASDVGELIRWSRQNPGKLSYASTGAGSAAHLGVELLRQRHGLDALHVPYAVGTASTVDLIDGRIDFKLEPPASAVTLLSQGRLKALGVTTPRRFDALPNVPAIAESVPGYAITAWVALFAPRGTPEAAVARLGAELTRIVERPEVNKRFTELGMASSSGSSDSIAQAVRTESAMWADIIQKANIRLEN